MAALVNFKSRILNVLKKNEKRLEGYLADMNEYRNQMPNYWNKWMEKGSNWEREFNKRASIITDVESKKLYGIPSINNFSFPSAVWMYKEDAFKKYGIEFPSTIEELYQISLEIKEKTGKPSIWFYGNTYSSCIMLAYGIYTDSFYIDIEKNEYRYALLNEKWLDAMNMVLNILNNDIAIVGHQNGSKEIDENAIVTWATPAF